MTNDEAIKVLERYEPIEWGDDQDAFALAIKALEREIEYGQMVVDLTKGEKVDDWVYDEDENATTADCDDCIWNTCNYNKIDWDAEPVDCTDFIRWIRDEVMDEENWELNAVACGEVICRKLKKLGAVFSVGGYYHSADRPPYRIDPYGTAWVNAHDGQDLDKVGRVILDNFPYAKTFYPDRPRGEWIEVTNGRGGHECSECHSYAPSYASGDEHLSDYCPNCGARMKGGAE